jgi:hypothetical protein
MLVARDKASELNQAVAHVVTITSHFSGKHVSSTWRYSKGKCTFEVFPHQLVGSDSDKLWLQQCHKIVTELAVTDKHMTLQPRLKPPTSYLIAEDLNQCITTHLIIFS